MGFLVRAIAIFLMSGSVAHAEGNFGVNLGVGFPFLTQAGINFKLSDKVDLGATYNLLNLSFGEAKAKLAMPEVFVAYHPSGGSFFIGAGLGQESLEVSATDATTSTKITAEVDAMTAIGKLGWMWGYDNGGFWFGIDFAFIMPLDAEVTITAPGVPTTDPEYVDVQEAADKFGDAAYYNLTFARFGWVF